MNTSLRRTAMLAILLAWCAFLILGRWAWTGHRAFGFLAWNLILAAVPAMASTLLGRADEKRERWTPVLWFAIWLLFLPNAPYIVTDFVHLEDRPPVPFWFDIALYVSCAGSGLMLGYASTAQVQRVVARRFSAATGWAVASAALLLTGFGIYIGRFLRWNSWEMLSRPDRLIAYGTSEHTLHLRTVAVTLVYGVGVLLGYLGLRLAVHEEPDTRR